MLNANPIFEATEKVLDLVGRLRASGHAIKSVDLGGGLGVAYQSTDRPPSIRSFVDCIRQRLRGLDLTVMLEPGRSIVGPAGVLLTRVLYRKRNVDKEFVVVDAAMNDLIRPALYRSHHDILPLRMTDRPELLADVVGPVCETGDFLARDRKVANVAPGDFLALADGGGVRVRTSVQLQRAAAARRRCWLKAINGVSFGRGRRTRISFAARPRSAFVTEPSD